MSNEKESRIFAVMDEQGKIERLVQALTPAKVKAHLLRKTTVAEASGMTVSKWKDAGGEIEKAQGGE